MWPLIQTFDWIRLLNFHKKMSILPPAQLTLIDVSIIVLIDYLYSSISPQRITLNSAVPESLITLYMFIYYIHVYYYIWIYIIYSDKTPRWPYCLFLWDLTFYHWSLHLYPTTTLPSSSQNYVCWAEFSPKTMSLQWRIL